MAECAVAGRSHCPRQTREHTPLHGQAAGAAAQPAMDQKIVTQHAPSACLHAHAPAIPYHGCHAGQGVAILHNVRLAVAGLRHSDACRHRESTGEGGCHCHCNHTNRAMSRRPEKQCQSSNSWQAASQQHNSVTPAGKTRVPAMQHMPQPHNQRKHTTAPLCSTHWRCTSRGREAA